MGLADPVELFLCAAEVAFGLQLIAKKQRQDVDLRDDFAEAESEHEIGTLAEGEFRILLHWFRESTHVCEALIFGFLDEERKEAGFNPAKAPHA